MNTMQHRVSAITWALAAGILNMTSPVAGLAWAMPSAGFSPENAKLPVGVQRGLQQEPLGELPGLNGLGQIRAHGPAQPVPRVGDLHLRKAAVFQPEGLCDSVVHVLVDAQALVRVVGVGDEPVVLHEYGGGPASRLPFHPRKLVPDGEGQPAAGVHIAHPAPAVIRALQGLGRDVGKLPGAGAEVRVNAVAVGHIGVQNRMEPRLHRGSERL